MSHPDGTLIVAPIAQARITGYDAALVTARKIILMRDGKRAASAMRTAAFNPHESTFMAIVHYVTVLKAKE